MDEQAALAALNEGRASAVFVDKRVDLNQLPAGTDEVRLVQAAALIVERDRLITRLTMDQVEGILRDEIRS